MKKELEGILQTLRDAQLRVAEAKKRKETYDNTGELDDVAAELERITKRLERLLAD